MAEDKTATSNVKSQLFSYRTLFVWISKYTANKLDLPASLAARNSQAMQCWQTSCSWNMSGNFKKDLLS